MFHKISGIDKFYGKEVGGERRREYQNFPSKFFLSQFRKKIVERPFGVSLVSGIEKSYA